jgi:hypothetical protein
MPSQDTIFTDLGFNDVFKGSETLRILGIGFEELRDTKTFDKVRRLAKFINMAPDALEIAKQAIGNHKSPHIAPLDFLTEFANLQDKRVNLKQELEKVEKEIQIYE